MLLSSAAQQCFRFLTMKQGTYHMQGRLLPGGKIGSIVECIYTREG